MESTLHVARWLITIPCLMFGIIPLVVDISASHVLHPLWTPHARLHVVWLITTNSAIAFLAVFVLWTGTLDGTRTRLAAVLGICVVGGFWVAALTQRLYGGGFSDVGGVPPFMGLDTNAVVFTGELASLATGLYLAERTRRRVGSTSKTIRPTAHPEPDRRP